MLFSFAIKRICVDNLLRLTAGINTDEPTTNRSHRTVIGTPSGLILRVDVGNRSEFGNFLLPVFVHEMGAVHHDSVHRR